MLPLDVLDRVLNWPYPELRALPPNRMRLRVGVQNRLLFNGVQYLCTPVDLWYGALARGHVQLDSVIVDIGCGCGRFAMPLRDLGFYGQRFRGSYLGVDVDAEMLRWCRRAFPEDRWTWHEAKMASRTYRPSTSTSGESRPPLPMADATADFAIANSLFSHLLEDDFTWYIHELGRLVRSGGWAYFTAFCLEHVEIGDGSRWSFRHEHGVSRIESRRYPEAAVGYSRSWIEDVCANAGFQTVRVHPTRAQTLFRCRRD